MSGVLVRVLLAVTIMTSVTAEAQAVSILAASNASCGKWTTYRREYRGSAADKAAKEMDWVTGFISGLAVRDESGADVLKDIDSDGVFAWIDNYCLAHPIENLVDAAIAFYRARHQRASHQ